MAINPIQLKPKPTGGKGGLFGKIFGGLAGAIGGAFVGKPVAGAVAGSKIGGAVGGAADPAGQQGGRGVSTLSSAENLPEVQLSKVLEAKKLALNLPLSQQPGIIDPLDRTEVELRKRLGA